MVADLVLRCDDASSHPPTPMIARAILFIASKLRPIKFQEEKKREKSSIW
jgi:hypothetical protein